MITDKNSKGYKIAEKIAFVFLNDGSIEKANSLYERLTHKLVKWERVAIADTVRAIIKK